jgi:hypothetical protein
MFWCSGDLSVDATSEKHTVSIFRAEVVMLGNGKIYIGLEKGKAKGVERCTMDKLDVQ